MAFHPTKARFIAVVYRVNSPRIIHETIDDETIVIDFDSGTYYSARGIANRVWQWIVSGADLPCLIDGIAAECNATPDLIRAGVVDFVNELVTRELVAEMSATSLSPVTVPPTQATLAYSPPLLEVYTDMQELLLLDPIHEVGEQGWPQPR